jgi:DNA sulfur modification protein DndD
MIIKNITVENFQSYYGKQTLEFSKGLNLIIGNGGKGKSKLFNAFYWVLFGKIYITGSNWCPTDSLPYSSNFAMKRHEFINKKALFEAQTGMPLRVSVHIELEDDKGDPFEIERTVIATLQQNADKQSEDTWNVSNYNLKVSYESNMGTQVKTDMMASNYIDERFPEGIRNYIWFQGEALNSLINFREPKTLKEAVKHISYYPYYVKLSDIIRISKTEIEKLESKKIKNNKDNDRYTKELLSDIDNYRSKIEIENKHKEELEYEIRTIEMALIEEEGKISGRANFITLVNEYNECNQEIKEVSSELETLDNFQREQVPNLWVLRGITPLINKCKEIIKKYTDEQGTAPERKYLDNPGRAKLEEILRTGKCFVCGSDTAEGTDAHNWILHRMKEQEEYLREKEEYINNMEFSNQFMLFIGSIQDYPHLLKIPLESIDKQYIDSEEKMEKLQVQKRQYLEKKVKLDEQIEEVKKKHGVNPVQEAEKGKISISTINASRSSLESKQRKLATCQKALTHYKSELQTAEKKLSKTGAMIAVSETEWKNISIFLEDVCMKVQKKAHKDLLHKIEQRANEFYSKFTEHDNGYKGEVKIGEDYNIEFDAGLNTSHEDRKKMSIINAMLSLNQDAIGTFYPFICDAPTSSFDLETTHKYLLGIKDMFKQSIIMTKDVDIDSENYIELASQDNVSRIYLLESELYCAEGQDPELHEVSTKITRKK